MKILPGQSSITWKRWAGSRPGVSRARPNQTS